MLYACAVWLSPVGLAPDLLTGPHRRAHGWSSLLTTYYLLLTTCYYLLQDGAQLVFTVEDLARRIAAAPPRPAAPPPPDTDEAAPRLLRWTVPVPLASRIERCAHHAITPATE